MEELRLKRLQEETLKDFRKGFLTQPDLVSGCGKRNDSTPGSKKEVYFGADFIEANRVFN